MTKNEIVDTLAREQRVEHMVESICHQALSSDLKDLCQMVYLILLEYDEAKIQDLWDNGQINFFIARVILNQYRSSNSPFHSLFRKFRSRMVSIGNGTDQDEAIILYLNNPSAPKVELLSDELIPLFRGTTIVFKK